MDERWCRLQDTLARKAGVSAKIDSRPHPGGVSHSITIRRDDGATVTISDKWWRKNPQVWIGWDVALEGEYVLRQWPLTKTRADVARNVTEAMALAETRGGHR